MDKMIKNIKGFFIENKLFFLYIILTMIGLTLLRSFTVKLLTTKAFITDLGFVLLIGSFNFLMKQKNRFKYLLGINIFFTLLEIINTVYYKFYASFASISDLGAAGEASKVLGSIFEKTNLIDFSYILLPIIFILIYKKILSKKIINKDNIKHKKTQLCFIGIALICIISSIATSTNSDFSRLAKMWNRQSVVERFGLIMYQSDDIVQSFIPKVTALFGKKKANENFLEYFNNTDRKTYDDKNEYTNILKDKNIVFIHMEGVESYILDLQFNNLEVAPNLKHLASEGMYFTNFYPQISIGTSSDTEFTLSTSLMPVRTGSVFVTYSNRDYISIQKLLKNEGYATYSMHGNAFSMWNRDKMHPRLGYDYSFFEESFDYTNDDVINLGINDKLFFKQAVPIMANFEQEHEKYMGTIITLSNHSPFIFTDKYGNYNTSTSYLDCEGELGCETITTDYLEGTPVGNYIRSVHYADEALGEFIEYIKNFEYFNDTIFVFYGDHDAKLLEEEKNYLYNYNYKTGQTYQKDDKEYVEYNSYLHNLNKRTPLIIWTKNEELKNIFTGTVDYPMGMIDVQPTLGNMLGIKNEYALGHDIFNIKNENIIVFPNGNFLTSNYYYDDAKNNYWLIKEDSIEPSNEEIDEYKKQAEEILNMSNSIIIHNLLKEN